MRAPRPVDEEARLAALHKYELLDAPTDSSFGEIVRLASAITGTSQAYVTMVDRDRQWFLNSRGPFGPQGDRDVAFCAHTILGHDPMIVEDALKDERFANNPFVLGDPKIRFYAGVPLLSSEGQAIGTLCVMDEKPRTLDENQRDGLVALGRQVELQLELKRRWLRLKRELDTIEVEGTRPLPPSLIALAVHDLKSPLTATLAITRFFASSSQDGEHHEAALAGVESAETAFRMLADLLDVVLGRSGHLVTHVAKVPLATVFTRLQRSASWAARERRITLEITRIPEPHEAVTDADLLRRVLENLVDNALRYGGHGGKVTVTCVALNGNFEVRVSDTGKGIDDRFVETIFEPRVQLEVDQDPSRGPGRGLGLYFCRLAITALGGTIRVEPNTPSGATFVVTLPKESRVPTPVRH